MTLAQLGSLKQIIETLMLWLLPLCFACIGLRRIFRRPFGKFDALLFAGYLGVGFAMIITLFSIHQTASRKVETAIQTATAVNSFHSRGKVLPHSIQVLSQFRGMKEYTSTKTSYFTESDFNSENCVEVSLAGSQGAVDLVLFSTPKSRSRVLIIAPEYSPKSIFFKVDSPDLWKLIQPEN
jgi:hypothetical protein